MKQQMNLRSSGICPHTVTRPECYGGYVLQSRFKGLVLGCPSGWIEVDFKVQSQFKLG